MLSTIGKTFTSIFGSRNDRLLKVYRKRVEQINALEPKTRVLTDQQIREKTIEFRARTSKGEKLGDMLPEIMAVAREAMDRFVGIRNIFNPEYNFDPAQLPADLRPLYDQTVAKIATLTPVEEMGSAELVPPWQQVEVPHALYDAVRKIYEHSRPPFRARPFDVQLIGGMVLGEGKIAEMKTGEGKTIVAPLACFVANMDRLQCHVVTVNDYLVQRDRDWTFPFYYHLGLKVGAIHPFHMQPPEKKKEAYHCDVVYGTSSEFGFDYLRDNMKLSVEEQVQRKREYCIVDEVDSGLIDEARTPLIISGTAKGNAPRYELADSLARHLISAQRQWNNADEKLQQNIMKAKSLEGDIRNSRDKEKAAAMKTEMQQLLAKVPELEKARDQHRRYYEVEMDKKQAHVTHDGTAEAQRIAEVGSFYVGENMDMPHLLENAIRAHAVYERDKDYVVHNGEIIIVDTFTGRMMVGRQWSDGLHQAVEAKENVKIKEETQTMATVTLQNFFKLYKRLAGMTGTGITEATEFHEIYGLDVVCIPTNKPVIRTDRDDLVFISIKDKWDAIMDEIKRMNDIGRPVLVGTTSVEKSQMLSEKLLRRHGVKHEVLNAKQHDREAHIVAHAGELGAVMIATNMAGRGTDIKLTPIVREELIKHWMSHDILPREAKSDLPDDQLISMAYRHQLRLALSMKPNDVAALSDDEAKLKLFRYWLTRNSYVDEAEANKKTLEQCIAMLNEVPGFMHHKLKIFSHVEEIGGLHTIGTERHESRRIDNQLRGRAGRQGDKGSSRFFISLEDDLMKMFAGNTMLNALSKLGMKEGDAIEHSWITSSVERAQRKVEERNYEQRKNILEYDEVMEYQRNAFYGLRQSVLEGRDVHQIIFEYIEDSVSDILDQVLDRDYVPGRVAEWCAQTLRIELEPSSLRMTDPVDLEHKIRVMARDEIGQLIDRELGEYMSNDTPKEDWDVRGLSERAQAAYGISLRPSDIRTMNLDQVREKLVAAAIEMVDKVDVTPALKFLDPLYAPTNLANWCERKFGFTITPAEVAFGNGESVRESRARLSKLILDRAGQAYERREIEYPIDTALDMVFEAAQQGHGPWAAEQLSGWARHRYGLEWTPEEAFKMTANELRAKLVKAAEEWHGDAKLEELVDKALAEHKTPEELVAWARTRLARDIKLADLPKEPAERRKFLVKEVRAMLRTELSVLERYVLLQTLDTAWKDHLYAMDQLRDAVNLRGYAEKDPRIEYKREGSNHFKEMKQLVRDKVTDLIFKARLTSQTQMRDVYEEQEAQHEAPVNAITAAAAMERASQEQQDDIDAAERNGAREPDGSPMSEAKKQLHKERKKRR